MATMYDEVKQWNDEHIEHLLRLGFLKQTFRRNVAIYEKYLQYLESGTGKMDAVVFTADDFGITDRHVFRVIKTFAEDYRIV